MSLPDSILESRLDLSMAQVLEPGPGQLVVTATRTTGQLVLAGLFAVACMLCGLLVWRQWREGWLAALYPFGLLAPIFGIIALVALLGEQAKAFHAIQHRADIRAWMGPIRAARSYALPEQGRVRLTLRRERPSNANHSTAIATRWYDIDVADVPALGFTVASDREAARAFAGRLAAILGYAVQDEVEDDGVIRLKH
jgi:hypothetical protein